MSKKPSKPKTRPKKPQKSAANIGKSYVLFGLDENEKPRGATFSLDDEALLTRMATGLGLRIGFAAEAKQVAVARKLPKGDVHATGAKAVPNIEQELYDQLNELVGGETGVLSTSLPATHDQIQPGHTVVAEQSNAEGWWAAVVVKRHEKDLVLLWRDSPGLGEFIRDVSSVALLKND